VPPHLDRSEDARARHDLRLVADLRESILEHAVEPAAGGPAQRDPVEQRDVGPHLDAAADDEPGGVSEAKASPDLRTRVDVGPREEVVHAPDHLGEGLEPPFP